MKPIVLRGCLCLLCGCLEGREQRFGETISIIAIILKALLLGEYSTVDSSLIDTMATTMSLLSFFFQLIKASSLLKRIWFPSKVYEHAPTGIKTKLFKLLFLFFWTWLSVYKYRFCYVCLLSPQNGGMDCVGSELGEWRTCNFMVWLWWICLKWCTSEFPTVHNIISRRKFVLNVLREIFWVPFSKTCMNFIKTGD